MQKYQYFTVITETFFEWSELINSHKIIDPKNWILVLFYFLFANFLTVIPIISTESLQILLNLFIELYFYSVNTQKFTKFPKLW